MKFIEQYQISSYDLAHNNRMRIGTIQRYMMETANRNMFVQKPSYSKLLQQGYVFLVGRIHIKIYGDLKAYDHITAETWAVQEKGASFDRCYRLLRNGKVMAEGYCVFGLLNLNTQKLCRAGDVKLEYCKDEPLPLSTRFRLPDTERQAVGTRTVRYADIDCNGHMNNANYPDMLCDFIPNIDSVRVTDIQIQYASEAPLGEVLTVYFSQEETEHGFRYAFETIRRNGMVNVRALIEAEPAESANEF